MKKEMVFIMIFVFLPMLKIYPASSNLTGDAVVYPGEELTYYAGNVGAEDWLRWDLTNGTFYTGGTSWAEKGSVVRTVKFSDVAEKGRISFVIINNNSINGYMDVEILSVANSQVDSIKAGGLSIFSDTIYIPKGNSGVATCYAYMVFPATKGGSERNVTNFRWEFPPSLGGDTVIRSLNWVNFQYNSTDGDGEKITVRPASTTRNSTIISYGAPRSYTIKRIDGVVENRDISVNESFEGEDLIFRNVNIYGGVYVPINGYSSVRLLPQFHAYYGSNVHIWTGRNRLQANNALLNAKAPADVSGVADEPQTGFSQNYPNPCSVNTMIDCCLPEGIGNASLYVVSSTGQIVRNISISERGSHVLNLDVSGLSPGLYLYYVVADGKMLGSKRMVIANR